mmetsp:Transcript_61062/g.144072  ORF Transcript_61062/g.144072 Transcript_61062/m.144072 type:complete len:255 (+) Transcript_61062:80-844(+)
MHHRHEAGHVRDGHASQGQEVCWEAREGRPCTPAGGGAGGSAVHARGLEPHLRVGRYPRLPPRPRRVMREGLHTVSDPHRHRAYPPRHGLQKARRRPGEGLVGDGGERDRQPDLGLGGLDQDRWPAPPGAPRHRAGGPRGGPQARDRGAQARRERAPPQPRDPLGLHERQGADGGRRLCGGGGTAAQLHRTPRAGVGQADCDVGPARPPGHHADLLRPAREAHHQQPVAEGGGGSAESKADGDRGEARGHRPGR